MPNTTESAGQTMRPRDNDQLDQVIAALRAGGGHDPRIGGQVGEAMARCQRLPRIQIAGRAGSGRSTVQQALALMSATETAPVDAPGVTEPVLDADIVIYVLSGAPLPADRRVLATLPPEHTVVVLNKADAVGAHWGDAVAAAEQYSREFGVITLPVIASLAIHTRAGSLTDGEMATLRRLAMTADPSLTLSADLFTAPSAGPDVAERGELLKRWDLAGVACALIALRNDPELAPHAVLQIMHAASGIDPLHRLLHRRYEQASALRGGLLIDELARLAACAVPGDGGNARDVLENYLYSDQALWLGLCAGLASPTVAHLAAAYQSPTPADADDAIGRAVRWRAVVSSDMPPAARRAALHVHNGYVRLWERMSSAGL